MNILIYVRPATKKFYIKLVKKAYPYADIVTVSDFRNVGDVWLGNYIYRENNGESYFPEHIRDDIKLRCRFLRILNENVADNLINNAAFGLEDFFSANHFDVVLGGLIDNYTQDILERITKKNGIPYIAFVGHFFNGYCRISTRGEYCRIPRTVSETELDNVLNQVLHDNYLPNFKFNARKSIYDIYYYYSRELFKKNIYFPIMKAVEKDYLNYHYNTTLPPNRAFSSVISKNIDKYFTALDKLTTNVYDNSVYMPLHFTPEATVDYWADDPSFALQDETITKIVSQTPPHIKLLIKEHPAMYFRRQISFYEKLLSFDNVILIHPYESSNSLLRKVQNVLVITGSVGVEALLRNKRVLSLTTNYYSALHPNIHKISKIDDQALGFQMKDYPQKKFTNDILQGLFKAKFYNNKMINKSEVELMSIYFKSYIKSIS